MPTSLGIGEENNDSDAEENSDSDTEWLLEMLLFPLLKMGTFSAC